MRRNIKILQNNTLAFLFVAVLGCKQSVEKPPILKEDMGAILLDIHIAEAYAGLVTKDSSVQSKISGKNLDTLAKGYQSILAHHGVTYDQFQNAVSWYCLHPAAMDSVYDWVMPRFDSLKAIPLDKPL